MVLKKMDALEFVSSLEGGWDTIIFDPPYMNDRNALNQFDWEKDLNIERKNPQIWNNAKNIKQRLLINQDYLDELKNEIISKITNCLWVDFNKTWIESNYNFIWYKSKSYGTVGMGYIKQNCSFVSIKSFGDKKPERYKASLSMIEEHKYNRNTMKALEIPFSLIEKILLFCKSNKVLDCFAGQFVTAKVCKKLNIEIDSCDKYINPPIIEGLSKFIRN
jgi:16S rRNA G966 N2-methylase RsmD